MTTDTPVLVVKARPRPRTVRAQIIGGDSRPWTCSWGDGTTSTTKAAPNAPLEHTYRYAGRWSIAVKFSGEFEANLFATVLLRPEPEVGIEAQQDPVQPGIVWLHCTEPDDAPISRYEIAWGDDTPPSNVILAGGDVIPHSYELGGYRITIRELDAYRDKTININMGAPVFNPDYTLTADGTTATLTFEHVEGGYETLVSFGVADIPFRGRFIPGDQLTYHYQQGGLYIVQAAYPGSNRTTAKTITIGGRP